MTNNVVMKVASFFSGIGGFDLGLERAGMEVVFQCEKDTFAQKVLRKHWPNVILKEDINDVSADDVPESDLWCGGFPCQDLSLANQGKRKGLIGERSGLFYKYVELISRRKPRWVIIENVPGLLNSHSGNDFRVVIESLDELGYCVSWKVLDAKFFGTPQRRRRVFIVGSLGNILSTKVFFDEDSASISIGQGFRKEEAFRPYFGEANKQANIFVIQHASIGRKHTAGPQSKGYRNDGEAFTLDSRGSSDVVCKADDSFGVRVPSRIPTTLDGSRFRSIGNAVVVPIVEYIGKRIVQLDLGQNSG